MTADGFSHMFALVCLIKGIPVVGSFHTDLMDLLATHNAMGFQSLLVNLKEQLDSVVLSSCATTSVSFAVSDSLSISLSFTPTLSLPLSLSLSLSLSNTLLKSISQPLHTPERTNKDCLSDVPKVSRFSPFSNFYLFLTSLQNFEKEQTFFGAANAIRFADSFLYI